MRTICLLCAVVSSACAADADYSAARAQQMASVLKQKAATLAQQTAVASRRPAAIVYTSSIVSNIPCLSTSPGQIRDIVDDGARRTGLDASLVHAVVRKESAYNPCAISTKGAQGLMQLMPSVQMQFGVTNPYDPRQNVDAGTRLLKQLLDQYGGDLTRALGAYNAGPARIEQFGGVPPYPETINYVSGILDDLSQSNRQEKQTEMRVTGYVDGMNFYESSKDKQWYPAGWCNWTQTLAAYCPGAKVSIRYFTTLYTGRDQSRVGRQQLHLLAMKEVANAEIVYGSCRERLISCPNCKLGMRCRCGCDKRFTEKMTDVNIAVRLLEDAVDKLFDRAYLMSADVDLAPAIHVALRRAPESQLVVLLPPEAIMPAEFADLERIYPRRAIARHLDIGKLRRFPDDLPSRWGMKLPAHWAENAGKRPLRPEAGAGSAPVRAPGSRTPWFEESVGYGGKSLSRR